MFYTLLLPEQHNNDSNLIRCALLVYALYRTHNHITHNPDFDPNTLYDTANQYIFEGTIGHKAATNTLDQSYTRTPRHRHKKNPNCHPFYLDNQLDHNKEDGEISDMW